MARPTSVTVSSAASSNPIPINWRAENFAVSIGCDVSDAATLTYKVQHTFEDIYASGWSASTATWFDHDSITGKTADDDGNYAYPVRAVRLTVTAYTSGSVTMTVIQNS